MKKRTLFLTCIFLACSLILPATAQSTMFLNRQCKITDEIEIGPTPEGYRINYPFTGTASGPDIKKGTVTGIDYFLIDNEGVFHLNVYYTVTDKDGDQLSIHLTGKTMPKTDDRIDFIETTAVVVNTDHEGTDYFTTGKFTEFLGVEFDSIGFLTDLRNIHDKLYWQE